MIPVLEESNRENNMSKSTGGNLGERAWMGVSPPCHGSTKDRHLNQPPQTDPQIRGQGKDSGGENVETQFCKPCLVTGLQPRAGLAPG